MAPGHVSRRRFFSCPTNQELVCCSGCLGVSGGLHRGPCGAGCGFQNGQGGAAGRLRGPPGASRGLQGPPGAPGTSTSQDVGFGSGFRVFLGLPALLLLGRLKYRHFQASSSIGLARGAPKTTPRRPRRPRLLGLGFLNNLVNHRKGEEVPLGGAPAPVWGFGFRVWGLGFRVYD